MTDKIPKTATDVDIAQAEAAKEEMGAITRIILGPAVERLSSALVRFASKASCRSEPSRAAMKTKTHVKGFPHGKNCHICGKELAYGENLLRAIAVDKNNVPVPGKVTYYHELCARKPRGDANGQ